MEPFLSFIIPYHNEPEAMLRACLESIQKLPIEKDEAEIILVDDGSKSAPSFPLEDIKYVRQEQAGLSVARNTGISQARGRYIQFVDADDCLIPSAYSFVLEQLRMEQADVVMFRMTTKYKESSPTHSPEYYSSEHFLLHHNLRAAACGYAFRKEILDDLRFRPGLLHEDELFTPQLLLRAKCIQEVYAVAYFYRQHEGTITSSKSQEKVLRRLNDMHFILNKLHSLGNPLLERKVRQFTVDYLQKSFTLTHSLKELKRRKRELRREGFLPLPHRLYSLRYLLASFLF